MDKRMDFPTERYPLVTPEREALLVAHKAQRALVAAEQMAYDNAVKAAKRSPKKWTPEVVSSLLGGLSLDKEALRLMEVDLAAEAQASRDARRQVLLTAARQILETIAPVTLNQYGTPALRIALASNPEMDLVVIVRQDCDFEVVGVKAGTDEKVFGYDATVYGPQESYRTEGLKPAYASWGSWSGMDTVSKAETMVALFQTAILVATLTNQYFGL